MQKQQLLPPFRCSAHPSCSFTQRFVLRYASNAANFTSFKYCFMLNHNFRLLVRHRSATALLFAVSVVTLIGCGWSQAAHNDIPMTTVMEPIHNDGQGYVAATGFPNHPIPAL